MPCAYLGAFALTNVTGREGEMSDAVSSWLNNDPLYDDAYSQATLRVLYLLVAAGRFPSTL
ncbi:MAG: hypothetical protein JW940_15880 [Polyangiaceae bacterium]|nr:hypothetical protein [Polyangiaceae bacterium]